MFTFRFFTTWRLFLVGPWPAVVAAVHPRKEESHKALGAQQRGTNEKMGARNFDKPPEKNPQVRQDFTL